MLSVIAGVFLTVKYMYIRLFLRSRLPADGSRLHLIPFTLGFSIIFLLGLHGASTLKILFILSVNYGIAKFFGSSKANPVLTWLFNMGVLFAIERNNGFKFASLSPSLAYLVRTGKSVAFYMESNHWVRLGQHYGSVRTMVHTLQHHNVAPRLVQHGLLLGV